MQRPGRGTGSKWTTWALLALALVLSVAATAAPRDITGSFAITRSSLVLNRATNTYDATVTLRNSSASSIPAPIVLTVGGFPSTVALANKAGQTPDGRSYLVPSLANHALAAGASVTVALKFANPQRTAFPYTLAVQNGVDLPLDAPSLMAVVATGGTNAFLIGRVVGASNLPITLQPSKSTACIAGTLVNGLPVGNPVAVTTDPSGYFGVNVSNVNPGAFVAVNVVTPTTTAMSACLVSSRDNDSWPKAFALDGAQASAQDLIDAPGKARWYKFAVVPGQTIDVRLTGLPADYDLAVFRDIGQAFASQFAPGKATTSDLLKLTAEYAPSVFSPSVFSPSVFSPSVFSPSVFSPSVFSPSVFSPSVFSPSVFSPSVFSPSVFSPSVFSPSVFSPSVFSPSVFSSQDLAQAFSTAQTRSVISVAATPGTSGEATTVNTWTNTGSFYVRVVGHNGAFNTSTPFTLTVTKGPTTCGGVTDTAIDTRTKVAASGQQTVILTDSSRTPLDAALNLPGGGTLRDKLATFAKRADVSGVVVDVAGDARVQALKSQAANNPACPFAKNLVAQEIKGIVDAYRANPLRYVVIVGNDDAIPFFRTPDESGLGEESGYVPPVESNSPSEASLRRDYVLSQDGYGSTTSLSLRTYDFPVPGLAVGRLVETPVEIGGLLDAYTNANGVVVPKSSLVTGYDFLADDAGAVRDELQQGTGVAPATLIAPNGISPQDPASWTADQLRAALFGAHHDLVFLAGHFSANSALAADFSTSVLTTELAASTNDFTNSIVFSAGCHSGYNLVDGDAITGVTQPLDWAQAFARKGATLVAGTGYQYGDTDFLEYSERVYDNFAKELRAGSGSIAIGEALVRAKRDYLAVTPDIRGLHEKALLEATLFGLPMLGVNMPAGRGAGSGASPVINATAIASGPGLSLGMKSFDITVAPTLTPHSQTLKNTQTGASIVATWQSGPDGVVTRPGEPALPLVAVNVTPTDAKMVLRGVGFRGGTYGDVAPMFPFSGAPTTELRGVHVPFVSPTFYPARMFAPNYFGALSGSGGTTLLVTPVQHRVANLANGTSTERTFDHLSLRLFYSGNLSQAALSDAPSIVAVDARPDATGVAFTVQVVGDPNAGIQQTWVTYTSDGANTWTALDLVQCIAPLVADCAGIEDSRIWKGHITATLTNLKYVVQAVSGVGLVALDDNRGAYYGLVTGPPAVTTFTLDPLPPNAAYGGTITIAGTLSAGGTPVAGQYVTLDIGGTKQIGITDSAGRVSVQVPALAVTGSVQVSASFAGDETVSQSSTSAPLVVNPAPSTLAPSTLGGTLSGVLGGASTPLAQQSVAFTVNGPGGARTIYAITDYLGRATLPPPGLPAGDYTVSQMSFAGNATYAPASVALSQTFSVPKTAQSISFATLPGKTDGDPDFGVFANASSGLTVAYAASGNCTVSGNLVHLTGAGSCTITASQPGDANYDAAAPVVQTFTIASNGKADQVIAFGAAPTNVHAGDAPLTITATSTSPTAPPSGIPIVFSSLTTSVCTASGTNGQTITPVAQGTCTIAANEAGDASYNPAQEALLSFSIAAAGPVAQFAATGNMGAARSDHTATLLEDGRVLVAGGFGANGTVLGSAELYCPDDSTSPPDFTVCPSAQRGKFAATNALPVPAAGQTATRLHDGTVLLIGGANSSLQWFTPSTQAWSSSGPLALANRSFHTATLLGDGKLFVAGGVDSSGATLATTFIVDTSTTPWTIAAGPDLQFARESHSATLLPDGTVLIAGGRRKLPVDFAVVGEYELYDPSVAGPLGNGAITDEGAMSRGRFWHAAEIAGLRVLVTGGSCDPAAAVSSALSSTEFFSLDGGAEPPVACNALAGPSDLVQSRRAFTLTPLPDNSLIAIGGADGAGVSRSTSEIFGPAASTFALGPSLGVARAEHQSTLLLDGRVLVTGGVATGGAPLASAELFTSASGTSTANQRPVANAGTNQNVTVGATVQLSSAGSSDPENRPLAYFWTMTTRPAGSAAQLANANTASPTFVADKAGAYTVQLIVNDGGTPPLDSLPASVQITAGSANLPPVANADSFTVAQDATLVVDAAQGVLANDSDPNGDTLTAVLDASVTHGTLTLNANGSFTYVPTAGYSGADSFTYHASDGIAASNVVTASLTVTAAPPVNHPPVANAGTAQSVTAGQLVQLAGSCTDSDNDPTTAAWSFTSRPATSQATLSDAAIANPTFTADLVGDYVVKLVCNDGQADSAPASVTITAASNGAISLALTNASVVGVGTTADVTITLPAPAPSGGVVVSLSSDDTSILGVTTATVTVPATQTQASGTVSGVAGGSATLHASAPGFTQGTLAVAVVPTVLTVTNLNDSGPGSLRDAIGLANGAPDSNTILFASGLTGTMTLTSGQIRIASAMTIVGPGAASLTIDGNASDRIFTINELNPPACPATSAPSDYTVTISGLTLANASRDVDSAGGAINASHTLILDSVVIRDSVARNGGGLQYNFQYAGQSLTIANAQFVNDVAKTLAATTSTANTGGGLNISEFCTGARTTPASVTIANSIFSNNRVEPVDLEAYGAGIRSNSYADILIADSRIVGNVIDVPNPPVAGNNYRGAGLDVHAKSLQILRSEIADNVIVDATASDQTRAAGLSVINNTPDLQTPEFVTQARVVDSTISGNTVPATAGGVWIFGNVALEIDNSTIASNTAATGRTGAIVVTTGATNPVTGSNAAIPSLKLVSTIAANSSSGTADLSTNTTLMPSFSVDADHSLVESVCSSCNISLNGAANVTGVDPLLAPLAFNGGPTRTQAPQAGSPAIDAGSNPLALPTDQRGTGFVRTTGVATDIGAFETTGAAITLTLQTPTIGIGGSTAGTITLSQPAPVGGLQVQLASDTPGVATVSPAIVAVTGGATSASFTVSGVALGTATITASATGYASGSVGVTVATLTTNVITVGGVVVAPGQHAGFPVTLAAAAPAGGVTITLTSGNTGVVTVPASVFIPAGQSIANPNPLATGVAFGTTTINGTSSGLVPGSGTATVGVTGAFSPNPVTVAQGGTAQATLTLSSPAPAGGLSVNLTTANASVATVQSPITIAAGSSSAVATVTGVLANAATTLQASATGLAPVSATINVVAGGTGPSITVASATIGKDLEETIGVSLAVPAPAGNLVVTLTSSDPSKLLVASDPTNAGASSVTITIPAGQTFGSFVAQSLVASGSATVTASAPNYASGTGSMTFAPSGFYLSNGDFTTGVSSPNVAVPVCASRLSAGGVLQGTQALRPGATATITLANSNNAVGTLANAPYQFTGGNSCQSTVTFDGVAIGTSTITLTQPPGFTAPTTLQSVVATVLAGVNVGSGEIIGKDLQESVALTLSSPAPAGNLAITLTSSDPSKLLLAPDATTPGAASITITVPAGQSNGNFIAQSLVSAGTATVTASAPNYAGGNAAIAFAPSGFYLNESDFSVGVSAANAPIQVCAARLSASSGVQQSQAVRAGLAPSVALTSSNTAVGTIVNSPFAFTGGANACQSTATFDPIALGTSTVTLVQPAGFTTPTNTQSIVVSVVANINVNSDTLGKDLQESFGFSLSSPAPAGNLVVTITSSDSTKLRVASDASTPGAASTTVTVGAGNSNGTFYVQSLAGTGSATATVSAPGYSAGTATITFAPSGFIINSPGATFSTTTLAANTNIQLCSGRLNPSTLTLVAYENLRAGITPVNVSMTSSNIAVGQMVNSPQAMSGNQNCTPLSATGMQFDPVGAGTSVLTLVTPNGFSTPASLQTSTVTVSASGINVSAETVGKDLQESSSGSLQAPAPAGGVTVTLTSADGTKLRVAPDATTAGATSITIPVAQGSTTFSYYVHALDSTGSVTLTASAPGYVNGSAAIALNPSGFIVNSPGTTFSTTTLSANTNIQLCSVRLNPSTLNLAAYESLRAGITPVNVSMTSSNASVGQMVNSPQTMSGNQNCTPLSASGMQFDPVGAGTSVLSVVTPTGFSQSSNLQQSTATVTASGINVTAETVGKDLQESSSGSLQAPAPAGGVTVTLTSADGTKLRVAPNATTVGATSITIPVAQGSTQFNYYVHALDGTGSVTLTASAPGYVNGSAAIALNPSGFIVNSPGTTFSTTTLSANTNIQLCSVRLNPSTLNLAAYESLRAGIAPVNVSMTSSNTSVGQMVNSPQTMSGNQNCTPLSASGMQFDPVGAGTSVLSVVTPSGFSASSNLQQSTATVSASGINVTAETVGKDLQESSSGTLQAPAPAGGVTVTLTSADGTKLRVAPDAATAGATSITIPVAQGATGFSYYVHALDSTGSVTLTASAPGFVNGAATITLNPSGFIINSPGATFTTTAGAGNTNVQLCSGRLNPSTLNFTAYESLRVGVNPVSLSVTSSNPAVGQIVNSPQTLSGNQNCTTTTGGMQFDPLTAGTTVLTLGVPSGFSSPSNLRQSTATVNP